MRILGLDPSSFCGWCHGEPGGKPIYGTHRLPVTKQFSRKALALEAFLLDIIKANSIARVYAEKPILPKVTSFDAMISMAGIASVIGITCARVGIELVYVDMSTWRSEFGSPTRSPKQVPQKDRRKWLKTETIRRAEQLGYEPKDDNAADAIGIWHSMAARYERKAAAPMFDILEGMDV